MHTIAILGSTGSIGTQALEVISHFPQLFTVAALTAQSNDRLLEEQINIFRPKVAVLTDEAAAKRLCQRYKGPTRILMGEDGLLAAATETDAQTVLTSLVGFAGLKPTIAAIKAGKHIALANKETLVAAGEFVTALAKQHSVKLLPVDSEHSAIFQCLQGLGENHLHKIFLTASGGPFRNSTMTELQSVTVEKCLCHPNWNMGPKVTIDSSTLANKGLEVIEAHWLFSLPYDDIDVVVHPQSIVHSMIQTIDGSVIAQLGQPDMRLPIQYAFSYPARLPGHYPQLDFRQALSLTFEQPDLIRFPALKLAYEAGRQGKSYPCVFNAANEIAVQAFVAGKIPYLAIASLIEATLAAHQGMSEWSIDSVFVADAWAREQAAKSITKFSL